PSRFVHAVLHVTLHVWQPMHLSRFMTIATCALIFKPVDLLHLADRHVFITLVSDRSVIIESVTQLSITADHLRRFHMDTSRCIMASAPLLRNFRAWNLDMLILRMIHEHRAFRHSVTDNGPR